jgi:hypothetical protein
MNFNKPYSDVRIYKHTAAIFRGSSICAMQDGLGVLVVPPAIDAADRDPGCPLYARAYWPDRTVDLPLTQT